MRINHRTDILDAAAHNDLAKVRYFVRTRKIPVINITNEQGQTAAHIGAQKGNLDIVKYLIERDSSLCAAKDVHGNNVLHSAVENGQLRLTKYLLKDRKMNMYEPNDINTGNTIFHIAAEKGYSKILDYLVKVSGGDVNVRNQLGEPPLFAAVRQRNSDVIKHLTEKLDANVTVTDCNEDDVLFICAKHNNLVAFKYFVNKRRRVKFDLNRRNIFGRTIACLAAKYDHYDFVKYLVGIKFVDFNMADNEGRTPLHEAATNGNYFIVRYLCRHGARVHALDHDDKKPVDYASTIFARIYLENVGRRPYRPTPRLPRSVYSGVNVRNLNAKSIANEVQGKNLSYAPHHNAFSSTFFGDLVLSYIDSFLMLVNVCFGYRRQKTPLLMWESIIQRKIDILSLEAVVNDSSYENEP